MKKTEKLILRIDPERKLLLQARAARESKPLAAVVTEAVDLYLSAARSPTDELCDLADGLRHSADVINDIVAAFHSS